MFLTRPSIRADHLFRGARAFAFILFLFGANTALVPTPASADIDTQILAPVDTHVVEVIPPESDDDRVLVLLAAFGRVLRLESDALKINDLSLLSEVAGTERRIRVEFRDVGDSDILTLLEEIDSAPLPDVMRLREERENDTLPYSDPIETVSDTGELFRYLRAKRLRRDSQCFHRAYLWSYDLWTERGISSEKVFLFFTRKYIREYNYHWWFHVAPYVINDSDTRIVLDPTFTRGPLRMQAWTNVFMRNNAYCPIIPAYYGWTAHHNDKYCYRRQVNMYYYHPNRIEPADRNGYVINRWDQAGLRNSRVARPYLGMGQ